MEIQEFHSNEDFTFTIGNLMFHTLAVSSAKFTTDISVHSHSANSCEIHYIMSGEGVVTLHGKTFPVSAENIYITGPFVEHAQIYNSADPMIEFCIYLSFEKMTRKPEDDISNALYTIFMEADPEIHKVEAFLIPIAFQIAKECISKSYGYAAVVSALLQQFIVLCLRIYSKTLLNSTAATSSLETNYLIIENSFLFEYSTITLMTLSKRLNLSPRQTARILLKYYHKNFQQKKLEAKMSAALFLLQTKDMKISAAAEQLGYSSVEHFSSSFKKYHGYSPSFYRKKLLPSRPSFSPLC